MVKSFAHEIDGPWLQSSSEAAAGATSHSFNNEADPLNQKNLAANQTRDAQQHSVTTGGNDGEQQNTRYSKPTPVLKPRSQQGRGNIDDAYWLEAQYQDSLRRTKKRHGPTNSPEHVPHRRPGPTRSQ